MLEISQVVVTIDSFPIHLYMACDLILKLVVVLLRFLIILVFKQFGHLRQFSKTGMFCVFGSGLYRVVLKPIC